MVLLIGLVLVLAVAWRVVRAWAPTPPAWSQLAARKTEGAARPGHRGLEFPRDYEEMTVTFEIPPAEEFPEAVVWEGGCAHSKLSRILGIEVGMYGLPVLEVLPEGPAAKAGVRAGYRLGTGSDCPSSVVWSFMPREEARSVEWTVYRPKGGAAGSGHSDEPPSEAPSGEGIESGGEGARPPAGTG